MKVVHIITGLNDGGAEGVLYRLCKYDEVHTHIVISMMNGGKYASLLIEAGVVVYSLNAKQGSFPIRGSFVLYKLLQKLSPDMVQTWMYHSDLIGGLIARLARVKHVFWNIRHSNLEVGGSKKTTRLVAKMCAILSYIVPEKIICCAYEAKKVHAKLGYDHEKMVVIENGFDFSEYFPSITKAEKFKERRDFDCRGALIGMVGRFHPQKDHLGLLKSLAIVRDLNPEYTCLLIGIGLNKSSLSLVSDIEELGLENNVKLLGQRTDIPEVMNGLDIHVLSSSFGEGFPNVIAEAMACGTPCVATDVGDASLILGETGWVVPPKCPVELANGILLAVNEMNNNPDAWDSRKQACRDRVVEHYSIEKMTAKYASLYEFS